MTHGVGGSVIAIPGGRLRPLSMDDAPALHRVFADAAVMRFWSSGPHATLAETAAYVAGNVAGGDTLAIVPDGGEDATAELAGSVAGSAAGWVCLLPRGPGIAEIGIILGRAAQGRGLGRAACRTVIARGLADPALRRIMADVDPDNASSNRLFAGLGFTLEGRLRGAWHTHIGVRDSLIWGLLASDPEAVSLR